MKTEGIAGFYRGVTPTIPTLFLYNSTLFTSFGFALDKLSDKNQATYNLSHIALAGVSFLFVILL
jgi:hypothetical protein